MRKLLIHHLLYRYIFRTNWAYSIALYYTIFLPFLVRLSLWTLPVAVLLILIGGYLDMKGKHNFTHSIRRSDAVRLGITSLMLAMAYNPSYATTSLIVGVICLVGTIVAERALKPVHFSELSDASQQWEHGKTLTNLPKEYVKQWDYLDRYFKKYYYK